MSTVKSSSENLTLNADGAGNDVVIQSNGTTKAIVTAEGLLGIGTASPTEELHISGSTDVRIALENTANRRYDIVSGDSGEFKIWDTAVGERMQIDTSNNFKFDSGYGSVTTAYGCRAWVKFNGSGTVAINNSANVSSITDLGIGRYRVNFTTAMVDADFAAVTSNANRDGGCYGHSTTDVGVFAGESAVDSTIISVAIFR